MSEHTDNTVFSSLEKLNDASDVKVDQYETIRPIDMHIYPPELPLQHRRRVIVIRSMVIPPPQSRPVRSTRIEGTIIKTIGLVPSGYPLNRHVGFDLDDAKPIVPTETRYVGHSAPLSYSSFIFP